MRVSLMGVKVDDVSRREALGIVEGWMIRGGKHMITTPNPEFLVAASKDPAFKKVLNQADLAIPDGIGLKITGQVKNRVTGIDLMEDLVALCARQGYSVGFLGGRIGIAKKTADELKKNHKNLKVSFIKSGMKVDTRGNTVKFTIPKTDILFVAFGHGKQEKWIARNLSKTPVKVMMGVGGSFNYISGSIKRAPKVIRVIGLEWLFRLVLQPWRIKRQFALLKFIWLIITSKS